MRFKVTMLYQLSFSPVSSVHHLFNRRNLHHTLSLIYEAETSPHYSMQLKILFIKVLPSNALWSSNAKLGRAGHFQKLFAAITTEIGRSMGRLKDSGLIASKEQRVGNQAGRNRITPKPRGCTLNKTNQSL